MYKIVEHADGTATVWRSFNRTVLSDHPSRAAAQAWIDAKELDEATAERARDKGMTAHCHYCGQPTPCAECGPEI